MIFKNNAIKELWKVTKPRLWPERYWMISFELKDRHRCFEILSKNGTQDHYSSVICDQHEVTAIVPETLWYEHKDHFLYRDSFGPLTCLTLDVPLDITVAGYLQPAVDSMADAGVSIVPQCALIHDHILITEADSAKAVDVVNDLRVEAGGR